MYYATYAEYEFATKNKTAAKQNMEKAIQMTENKYEKAFLTREKKRHLKRLDT